MRVRGQPLTLGRVARAIRRRWHDRLHPLNAFRGVYATFAEASRAAPRTKPLGYDSPKPAAYYRGRLDRIHHDDYPAIFWFRVALEGSESLFEIGGHVGVAYYSFARLVTYPPNLKWTILEVQWGPVRHTSEHSLAPH